MPRRLLPRPLREVSKRGQILVIFGFIWVVIGVGMYRQPTLPGYEHLLFTHIPTWLRAGTWTISGLVAIAFALRPRRITSDAAGFVALYISPVTSAAIFFWGWVQSLIPGDSPGYPRGLLGGAVYLALVAAVMVIASWPDPHPTVEQDS